MDCAKGFIEEIVETLQSARYLEGSKFLNLDRMCKNQMTFLGDKTQGHNVNDVDRGHINGTA